MRDTFLGATVYCHHKGGNSKAEMQKANQLSQQQLGIMQNQLGMQKAQLAQVNPTLQSQIAGGGLLPGQEATLQGIAQQAKAAETAQALNTLPDQYRSGIGQINNALVARGITGGQMAGSGDIARNYGSLMQGLGNEQANLMTNVQMQDAANQFGIQQMKMQGLTNALNQSIGVGGMYGNQALGFGGQGVSALGQGVTAANNADQASTAFWGSVLGAAGSLGGAAIKKCWVAAELYGGWLAPETIWLRRWIFSTWYMKPFAAFYARFGETWAAAIRRNVLLRRVTQKLFDLFLSWSHGS